MVNNNSASPLVGIGNKKGALEGEIVQADPQLRVIEDPLAEYIQKNWRSFVYSAVTAIAIFYGYGVFRETAQSARESGGDNLTVTQRQYEQMQALSMLSKKTEAQTKSGEELKKKLEQSLHALSFSKEPFPEIGAYYQSQLNRLDNSSAAIALAKQTIAQASFKNAGATGRQRLLTELDFFSSARQLIDTDKPAAIQALKQLIDQGTYLHAVSALTIWNVAQTAEEKKEAKELLDAVVAKHPEQDEVLHNVAQF